ncbi:uncharacterized protein LOC126661914 [Mercurialis annua]|uniref:uncharacterized protein LOC126661914 n=1 Tax=Mercurialis annua TaxID=3986 RepID=UPI00215F667F|nr:uncharacterized protein LOC126661914 [Mercurialis annua]
MALFYSKPAKGLDKETLFPLFVLFYAWITCLKILRTLISLSLSIKGCKSSNINHLMFADGFLLFCHGNMESINFLNQNLFHFKDSSGLEINPNKSQVFFCNVNNTVKDMIMSTLRFKEGILPLRYLGIPLITTTLSKLQLIQSVMLSMHVFGAVIMILPYSVIKSIQSICSRFLWNGTSEGKYSTLISWNDVKWIKNNKLTTNSYWGAKANYSSCWIWRGLIGIKDKIQRVMSCKIGDEPNTVFWSDLCINGCTMIEKFPTIKMREADFNKFARVVDVFRLNRWVLPDPMDSAIEEAWEYNRDNFKLQSNTPDKIE